MRSAVLRCAPQMGCQAAARFVCISKMSADANVTGAYKELIGNVKSSQSGGNSPSLPKSFGESLAIAGQPNKPEPPELKRPADLATPPPPLPDPQPLRFGLKPGEAEAFGFSESMMRVVDLMNGAQAEKNQVVKHKMVAEHQRHEVDTGSPEVQVAILTARISRIASHLKEHHHDRHSHRGLIGLVNQRRKLLQYLKRKKPENYSQLIAKLNIRDVK